MGYVDIIKIACFIFPFIAFLITLPFVLYNYHKYGSVKFIKSIIIYTFILYLMIAYFMIILPLPSFEEVRMLTTPTMQLIPFNFVIDIIKATNFSINSFASLMNFFKEMQVYQVLYNILLTLPFGVYLRYYFKKDLKTTIFFSFLLSLFFELTQLSGLYFIYPRAYRLFDVDDLLINTLGGTLGYLITPLFTFFLPTRDNLDKKAYIKGEKVSSTRRFITFIIDLVLTFILIILLSILASSLNFEFLDKGASIISLVIIFIVIPIFTKGSTIGGIITKLKVVSLSSKGLILSLILRNVLLYVYLCLPFALFYILMLIGSFIEPLYFHFTLLFTIFVIMLCCCYILIRNIIMHKPFLFEVLSKTRLVSTIKFPLDSDNQLIDESDDTLEKKDIEKDTKNNKKHKSIKKEKDTKQ